MTIERDFLTGNRPAPISTNDTLVEFLRIQNELLRDIRRELLKQNPQVLTETVVQNAQRNAIGDTRSHKVVFQIGGKPVTIHSLLAYSTYGSTVNLNILTMSNIRDGIPFSNGDVLILPFGLSEVYIQVTSLSGTSCFVNGPANSTNGGFFLYGWTISDYVRENL